MRGSASRCCCKGKLYVQWRLATEDGTQLWLSRLSPWTGYVYWDRKLADDYTAGDVFCRGLAVNSLGQAITCNGKIVNPDGTLAASFESDVSALVDTTANLSLAFADVAVDFDDKIYVQDAYGSSGDSDPATAGDPLAAFRFSADGQTPEEWYAQDARAPDGTFADGDESFVNHLLQITLDVGNLTASNPALLTGGNRILGGYDPDLVADVIYAERYFEFDTTGTDPVRQLASQYSLDIFDGSNDTYASWRRSNTRSLRADSFGRAVFGADEIYETVSAVPGVDPPDFLGHLWVGSAGSPSFVINFADGVTWGEAAGDPIVECVRTGRRSEIYAVAYDTGEGRGPGVVDPSDEDEYSLFRINSSGSLIWKLPCAELLPLPAMDVDSDRGDVFVAHQSGDDHYLSRLLAADGATRWTSTHFAAGLIAAVAYRWV